MTKTEICNIAILHLGGRPLTDVDTDTSQTAVSLRAFFDIARDEMLRSFPWNFATKRVQLKSSYNSLVGVALTGTEGDEITVTDTAHGLSTGDRILIENVEGISGVNADWMVTVLTVDTFTLDDSSMNGSHVSGTGRWVKIPIYGKSYEFTAPSDALRIIALEDPESDFLYEKGKILANSDTILVKYVQRVTDTSLWAPDFTTAFAYLLASYVAQTLNGPAGEGLKIRQLYEQTFLPQAKISDARESRQKIVKEEEYSPLMQARRGGLY